MDEGPDSGRAWLVAFAGFIINMISAGIYRAQGLLFVSFMNTFHIDRQKASMPFSIRMAVRNLLAPIIGILGQKYGASCVIISGGLLGTMSAVLCFFAPDLAWITFFWGGLYGLSTALITVLPQLVISQYFIKHRTTATGLSFSGGCSGSLAFPAILEYLLHSYGLHGTFFILAGIIMHVIPAAMIIKQPPWCRRDKKKASSLEVVGNEIDKAKTRQNLKGQLCERGVQVGNYFHDNYQAKKALRAFDNSLIARKRSYSCNALTYQMNNLARSTTVPSMSTLETNYKTISSYPEHIFDIDLDYLKQNCDLLFHMMSMEIPNMEISYRAILLEVEQDDLWHPDKNEIMQEIEGLYHHIEKALEIDPISNKKVRANGLYIRKTLISGTLTMSKKSESLRAVRRYFRTYRERGLQLGKIRSAPNISNIYNELARKDYVLSKLKQLCNSNEIRIISHLCQYNPKDVLKVLFQIRTLYRIYYDLDATMSNNIESSEICEPRDRQNSDEGISIIHKSSCTKETEISAEEDNNFKSHIKTALKLHTNPLFLLLVCTRTAFFLSFTPVVTIIVDFAIDRGLQEEDGKYIIGALAFGDLLGRIGLGWITDRGYTSLPRYMLVSLSILSLCTASIPLMYSRWSIFSIIALFGMIQGSMFVRHPVLVVKYLNEKQRSIAMGCMEFSSGIICFILPVYIGFFRDTMGFYDPIFYINGIIVFLAAVAWLFEPKMAKATDQQQK